MEKLNKIQKNYLLQLVYLVFIFSAFTNVLRENDLLNDLINGSLKFRIYILLNLIFGVIFLFLLLKKNNLINRTNIKFKQSSIPRKLKLFIIIIVLGNTLCVFFGKAIYPFYNVGMFSGRYKFENKSKILKTLKYFYYHKDELKILDTRKEGFYFLSENLGLRFTHEYTFAATFHNKGEKKNFEFLLNSLKNKGIDSLWVGVQYVDYENKKVWFDSNICDAVNLNNSEKLYYGQIYIPKYQNIKCNE